MKVYHLIFDGSYAPINNRIGLGVIHYEDGEVNHIDSISVDASDTGVHSSLIAEGLAACAALDYAEPNSEIHIYGDNIDIIRLIQGKNPHHTEMDINIKLQEKMGRHERVFGYHISETKKLSIPEALFSMAHNASAVASGSKKRQKTPGFHGLYSHSGVSFSPTSNPQRHMPETNGMEVIEEAKDEYPTWDPRSPNFKL